MAKKRTFTVQWDKGRERFTATDENGDLLGSDRTLDLAIGSAVREANQASKAGCSVTVKVRNKSGKLKVEYVAQPLG